MTKGDLSLLLEVYRPF
ncbi:uncharacterized protein FFE2_16046 [Fusarium fujikuroi]|nr:uncharacterized protein FFE2_16046 [Fusarium fujikuroi]